MVRDLDTLALQGFAADGRHVGSARFTLAGWVVYLARRTRVAVDEAMAEAMLRAAGAVLIQRGDGRKGGHGG